MKKGFFNVWESKKPFVLISFNSHGFMGMPPQACVTREVNGNWIENWYEYEITIFNPYQTCGTLMMSVKLVNENGVEMYFNISDPSIEMPMDGGSIDLNNLDFSKSIAIISKSNMDFYQGLKFQLA